MKGAADRISHQPKWKKVAYGGMQPGNDDNYTHKSFPEAMVVNANVVKRDMFKVMQDSVSISQYLCIFALVISVWIRMLGSVMDETSLLKLDVVLLELGFSVLLLATSQLSLDLLSRYLLNISFFISGLYILAPVFLFAPLITFCIKKYSFKLHLGFPFALMSVTLSIVFWLHRMLFVLLLGLPVFVSVVCPYWLIRIQEYKFEINGSWDEAKLCLDITE